MQRGDLVVVQPTTSGDAGEALDRSPRVNGQSPGEHAPVNAEDLASVAGKEGHTSSASSGAIARRSNLEGNLDRDGLKLGAAIQQLAVMIEGRREPSGWAQADLQVRLPINRVLAEIDDPRALFPGADGQLRAREVPLVEALLAGVKVRGMDDYANAVSTQHRYLESLLLLTQGDDLPKATALGSLLLKERLALLGRNSSFGFGTYLPPHDDLGGYTLSVREELFLPSLIQVAARNGLKGGFADELAAAIQREPRLQSELVATLAKGIGATPPLAVAYLRHLAREGAAFLQLDRSSKAEPSPQDLFLRKVLDPTFVIESGTLIDAARRYHGETTLDELLPANGIRIDAKVLREATDCLVIPRHLWDSGFRANPETLQRLIRKAELPAAGPRPLEVVAQHLREKYGPQTDATLDEGTANRRLASLYTLGQLGALSKADVDALVAEVISQSGRKTGPKETTLLAFVEELLQRGSNTSGREQQPMVVLRKQLGTILKDQGIDSLEAFGRYLVEQHGVKPKVLSDSQLSSLAELFNLYIPWKQGSRDLSELTRSIQTASAERTAREATLTFKVSALMRRLFGGG